MPEPKNPNDQHPPHHPPPPKGDVPPHILKELMELREKIGRLEGKMDMLTQGKNCGCGDCNCEDK